MNLTNRNLVDRRARRLASQTQRTARRSIPTGSTARERLGSTLPARLCAGASRVGASPARTFGALAEKLVSSRSKPVVIMNTTHSSILVAEVPGYAELQGQMHEALRVQHPEWIEADGKSPTCDSYEACFAELLVSHRIKSCRPCAPGMVRKGARSFPNSRRAKMVLV
jgi:hypothetical protein